MTEALTKAATIDSSAMLELWQQHKGIIHRVINRWARYGVPYDDLEQEAYFGLLQAVKHYERIGGGYAFTTVLGNSLHWYFIRYFKRHDYLRKEFTTLNAPINE